MSLVVLPRFDFSFLAQEAWGGITIGAVAGLWSVVVALAAATLTVVIINYRRLPASLQITKLTHGESYLDMVMTVIVGVIISLAAVIVLGATFGSF